MMKKNKDVLSIVIRKFLPLTLSAAMVFSAGCGQSVTEPQSVPATQSPTEPHSAEDLYLYEGVENLMKGRFNGHPDIALAPESAAECETSLADFSLEILKQCMDSKKNVMISPISMAYAFAMAANGAAGNTLEEFEAAVGQNVGVLDQYLHQYGDHLRALAGDNLAVSLANSIWFSEDMEVRDSFLDKNGQSFNAELFRTTFDQNAVDAINAWTKDRTFDMIPQLLKELSPQDRMVLINAVAVDAKWKEPFSAEQTYQADFTEEDGTERKVQMMRSMDEKYFLKDDHAKGFIKRYEDGLSFAALLPEEGMTTKEYIDTLSGEKLLAMLKNPNKVDVSIYLPRFRSECSLDLKAPMEALGVKQMFTPGADFSGISDEELFVGDALQKTFISVDEEGTKAAAVTEIAVKATGIAVKESVLLDRPFVYVIFDEESCLPLFIGTFQLPT